MLLYHSYIAGVTTNRATLFATELGVKTGNDLLNLFPHRYIDKTQFYKINQLQDSGSEVQIVGEITDLKTVRQKRGSRLVDTFYKHYVPFDLTDAQKRVLKEIRKDVVSGVHMNRLLQWDVGSGKTIVSIFAMLLALDNGFQATLITPTEILATQHYNAIASLIRKNGGFNGFKIADITKDAAILQKTRNTATTLLQNDPNSSKRKK